MKVCLLQTYCVPRCVRVCVRCFTFTRCTIQYCEHLHLHRQQQQQQLATFKRIFVNKCQNESVNKSEMDEIDASEEVTLQTSLQKKKKKYIELANVLHEKENFNLGKSVSPLRNRSKIERQHENSS